MAGGKLRQGILVLGLAGSVGAALWVHGQESDDAGQAVTPAVARVHPGRSTTSQDGTSRLALERLNHRSAVTADTEQNPFAPKSWYIAPPPPPPPPPPKPTAPVLPFQFMGQFEDPTTHKWMVYLAKGEESYSVSPGDKFADQYEFEGIEKGNLVIRYLPLAVKQYLPVGLQ